MSLITQEDFETKSGREKIVNEIHSLDHKVRELEQKIHELTKKEGILERDIVGYGTKEV